MIHLVDLKSIYNTIRELKIQGRVELLFVNLQETIEVGLVRRRMTCIEIHNKSGTLDCSGFTFLQKLLDFFNDLCYTVCVLI